MNEYKFIVVTSYRNKRENTKIKEAIVINHGITDSVFSHKETGVLSMLFKRQAKNAEEAVRSATEQLLVAMPDCILFEIHSSSIDRMSIRRSMLGFSMPWRFLDQGLPELSFGGLMLKSA